MIAAYKFSYFPPLRSVPRNSHHYPMAIYDLATLRDEIVSDKHRIITQTLRNISDEKRKTEYKASNFYSVSPNGIFHYRDTNQIKDVSGLFIADIDDLPDVELAKDRLITDPKLKPVLAFVSPSGTGIKAIYNIDPGLIDFDAEKNKMHKLFYSLNNYFAVNYSGVIIPKNSNFICGSGKDIPRLCFVGHDAHAYYKADEKSIIDTDFFNCFYKAPKESSKPSRVKVVSPRTTIDDLAKRYLITENHHDNIISFVGACIICGYNIDTVIGYIDRNVTISPDSAHSDREKLLTEISDLYSRYNTNTPGTVYLTPLEFAYDIFRFKHSREADGFVLTGIYFEGVRQYLHAAGFWKRYDAANNSIFIRQIGSIIEETTPEIMRDCLTRYVESITAPIQFTYQGINYQIPPNAANEFFVRNSNSIFNDTWLEHLQVHSTPVLKDTAAEIFIVTPSTLVTVTAESIDQQELSEVKDICIWKSQQLKRGFTYIKDDTGCHFGRFLRNVSKRPNDDNASEKNFTSLCSAIGYLIHNHTGLSEGQAVMLYDSAITDIKTPMGGTGKGLIANALKQVRDVTKIDGKQLHTDNKFKLELIRLSTQIAWFDDVKTDFDFSILHSNLTDGWTIERKYLPQIFIDPADSPKVLICSNSIIKGDGTTNVRRQFVFELGDYYSSKIKTGLEKPIKEEHGGLFFTDQWSQREWDLFFSLLCECGQLYLEKGLIPQSGGNVELNRFRQATNDDFAGWCKERGFEAGQEYNTKKEYTDFASAYYGENYDKKFSQRAFTNYLRHFARFKEWTFYSRKTNCQIVFQFETVTK